PYSGLYCVACELFYTEEELVDGLCPEHHIPPEEVEEDNYFFRLSRYADQLLQLIESDELRIVPQTRKNEVTSFIRMGLGDFSVSRTFERARGWGIPVPGDPAQVMYVWFDALTNYINALGYAGETDLYRQFWLENPNRFHVIGKGILRFHAVYWPAMLLSAGVPLPSTILVHGYITARGTRMSKTLGNVVNPADLVARYGTDPLRYFLLAKIPPFDDSDFTLERFVDVHNSELADQLGNLLSRVTAMVDRYCSGKVPAPREAEEPDAALEQAARSTPGKVAEAMDRFAFHEAVGAIWDLVSEANRYVVVREPWNLAKQMDSNPAAAAALDTCLYSLVEVLRLVAGLAQPFIPGSSAEIARQIGAPLPEDWSGVTWGGLPRGARVVSGESLFPKIELE
ncbi:MAG: class I tRNA ligase family protein, partial [Actinomycetota bacterium]